MLKRLTRLVLLLLGLLLVANDGASSWLMTQAAIAHTEAFDEDDPRAPDEEEGRRDALCVDDADADDDDDEDSQAALLAVVVRVAPAPSTRVVRRPHVENIRSARGHSAPERRPPRA